MVVFLDGSFGIDFRFKQKEQENIWKVWGDSDRGQIVGGIVTGEREKVNNWVGGMEGSRELILAGKTNTSNAMS